MPNCNCGHCDCEDQEEKSPEKKVDDLKEAIKELGYEIEETEDGIKISNS